ncbi:MAG: class I SAM-dependent rRNA methyltransferase [Clostridia bacterium]|nr:class I SAM-dependent rRNA methyltransferase [Clostridia bacterium]
MPRNYPVVTITPKGEKMLVGGHVWVYADEVTALEGTPENGALVDVRSSKGKYLGTGFYNENSKIRVRVVSKNANDRFDDAFWERKLRWALDYRRTVMGDSDFSCCRLIFGEADAFPGFTVDRFGSVIVTQVLSLGIERIKDKLYAALVRLLREEFGAEISVLYERNDVAIRTLEGMEQYKGFWQVEGLLTDTDGITTITENGIVYEVDYINGQKTGFFLDQKYNRAAIAKIAKGRRVLDCFTHTGSFGLNAARGGASHVTSVDISADAIAMAKKNAESNALDGGMDFVCADVFELLTSMAEKGKGNYDFIILDPPAFTKSRDTLKNAIRGYKEINLKAMKLLPRGGYLATCSCSHFMTETYFKQMLHNAAEDAGVGLRQIEARQQSPDHPILWNVPETDYLKFFIFQIV